jgi:hypothetical protein
MRPNKIERCMEFLIQEEEEEEEEEEDEEGVVKV